MQKDFSADFGNISAFSAIYVKSLTGPQSDWEPLVTDTGAMFRYIDIAIEYIRRNKERFGYGTGLATFNQMQANNAEWDNF
jgi:hypothetical protein